MPGIDSSRICFLRPGDIIFDALCDQAIEKFQGDVQRGVVFCDPAADRPYFFGVYVCQLGEATLGDGRSAKTSGFDRRLIAIRWDEAGDFSSGAPNHLLALQPAPKALLWKAGNLLLNPEDSAARADSYARMVAETHTSQTTSYSPSRAIGRPDGRSFAWVRLPGWRAGREAQ